MDNYTYTTADLATIRAARLRGIRSLTFDGRSQTYASDAEMKAVEDDILRSLAATSTTPRRKQAYGVASKGF